MIQIREEMLLLTYACYFFFSAALFDDALNW
jgi:hypothetical protein